MFSIRSFLFVFLPVVLLAGCFGGTIPSGDTSANHPDSLVANGRAAQAAGEIATAKSMYDAALELDPEHVQSVE